MARALVDPTGAALGPRAEALHRRALVDEGGLDDEVALVEGLAGLVGLDAKVRDRGLDELEDGLSRTLRGELERRDDGLGVLAADEVDDPTRLLRGDPQVADDRTSLEGLGGGGLDGHQRRRPFLSSFT